MEELVLCKSCGYVMKKNNLKESCPACGVPAKMFEPHNDRLSARRRFILGLDIHPVLVHFPQAFTFSLLILSMAALQITGAWEDRILSTLSLLSLLLPVTVLLAFCGGMFDGKIRFRKVTTPLLVRKMVLGTLFFVLSLVLAYIAHTRSLQEAATLYIMAGVSLAALAVTTVISFIGVGLLNAKFPG